MQKKELTIIKEVSPVVKSVQALVIETQEDMKDATTILSQLNKYADKIEEEKLKLTKPINEALKEIRSRYKPIEEQLDSSVALLKGKMVNYQSEVIRAQAEAELKIAKKLDEGKISVDKAMEKMDEIEIAEKKVISEEGSVSFREVSKFEVMDINILSKVDNGKYILPNEILIRQKQKEGIELQGVRYYKEQSIWNKRN